MHFYNEHNPNAAETLRELIKYDLIPNGIVDERNIQEIRAHELEPFTSCHFFAGIGGWPFALRLAGWPDSRPVWTGSCPCQPFSVAGKGLAESDERHLWPVWRELIAECRPSTIFGEQVASKAARGWLARVRSEMEALEYRVGAADLCAASVAAPHIRQRFFWVADAAGMPGSKQRDQSRQRNFEGPEYAAEHSRPGGMGYSNGQQNQPTEPRQQVFGAGCDSTVRDKRTVPGVEKIHGKNCGLVHADCSGCKEQRGPITMAPKFAGIERSGAWSDFDLIKCRDGKTRRIKSGLQPLADGIPGRVGLLRGYGNAIVPQLAAEFIKAYNEI